METLSSFIYVKFKWVSSKEPAAITQPGLKKRTRDLRVLDVIKQDKVLEDDVSDIEAGSFPIPGYDHSSSCALELVPEHRDYDANRKRPLLAKSSDHERKRWLPWTEEERKQFLLGLIKHGKGVHDIRTINLANAADDHKPDASFDHQANVLPILQNSPSTSGVGLKWTDSNDGAATASDLRHGY